MRSLTAPLRSQVRSAARAAADWVDLQWSATTAELREAAPHCRGRLLDIGCGEKPYEAIFRPYVDAYVGLEVKDQFAATRAAQAEAGPDVYYDGRRIPFEDESFDSVLCIQVIEHTEDPQGVVSEAARVLRSDGALILSAPFSFRLHHEPHDYFRYTPHGLESLCRRAGLTIERIWTQGSLWSAYAHSLNAFLAFRVARLDGLSQSLGKLAHERAVGTKPRYFALPLVVPAMVVASGAARILDRALYDPATALGYQVLARKAARGT